MAVRLLALALYLGMVSVGAATGVIGGKAAVPGASGGWGLGRWMFEVGSNAIVGAIALVSTCFHASLLVAVRQCRRGADESRASGRAFFRAERAAPRQGAKRRGAAAAHCVALGSAQAGPCLGRPRGG